MTRKIKIDDNTYEWTAAGIKPEKANLRMPSMWLSLGKNNGHG